VTNPDIYCLVYFGLDCMIGYHFRAALNNILLHRPIVIFQLSALSGEAMSNNLCDVYSTRIEGDKLYLTVADTRNEPHITETTNIETIPETVLNFERQTRKAQAAKRAEADVTVKDHLRLIYEDEHLVVVDKPSGVLCVPGVNKHSSLLGLVHKQFAPTVQPMDRLIVHRLDMDTSGLVVFGRTLDIVTQLHKIFRDREVEKSYLALVCGHVNVNSGLIDLPLQKDHERPPFMRVATPKSEHAAAQVVQDLQHHGWKKIMRRKPKPSTTEFEVISREYIGENLPVTRLSLKPITGRTHQLRVHCAALGHPIVADPAYGVYGESSANGGIPEECMDTLSPHRASLALQKQINALDIEHMCLHAKELSLKHPVTAKAMKWEAKELF
jgi:tRNA pseudouridine32 synthase / 23S rRNA pseudouridine746 synthase